MAWIVPNGQIQPQKTRPRTKVIATTTSENRPATSTVCVVSQVVSRINGSR